MAESYGGSAVNQDDLNKTINAIRNRPLDQEAINKGVQKTAALQLAALPDDPKRDSDISKLIWEIRRERRMEFVYEHTRLLDIKRWKKIEYMDNNKEMIEGLVSQILDDYHDDKIINQQALFSQPDKELSLIHI